MLLRENYTKQHILKLREETGAYPSILERTVFALGLLEALRSVDMPFIFKGGTSLLVLLDKPRRLSTDIDIIVNRDTDIDGNIEKAGKIFPFIKKEEHTSFFKFVVCWCFNYGHHYTNCPGIIKIENLFYYQI